MSVHIFKINIRNILYRFIYCIFRIHFFLNVYITNLFYSIIYFIFYFLIFSLLLTSKNNFIWH